MHANVRAMTTALRDAGSSGAPSRARHVGLAYEVRRTEGGEVALSAAAEHRFKIHAGLPVRGTCGAARFVYGPGDVDFVPAGMSDRWEEDGPSTSLLVSISPRLVRRAAEDMGKDPARVELPPRHQFRDARVEHIARLLAAEPVSGQVADRLYLESIGLALAAHLLGGYATSTAEARGRLSPRAERAIAEYVDAHLDRTLSLAELARVVGSSTSHFKTLFKRSFGLPVHAFVLQRRVERARDLLQEGELSISQIALEVGFAHASHMARRMRLALGVTPAEIRRGS